MGSTVSTLGNILFKKPKVIEEYKLMDEKSHIEMYHPNETKPLTNVKDYTKVGILKKFDLKILKPLLIYKYEDKLNETMDF